MRRKGISPLIAAVLLIAFTIAIGAIFAQWAPQLVNQSQDDSSQQREDIQECSSIKLEVMEADEENVTVQQVSGNRGVGSMTVTWHYSTDHQALQSTMKINTSRGINSTTAEGFDSSYSSAELSRIKILPTGCSGAPAANYEP